MSTSEPVLIAWVSGKELTAYAIRKMLSLSITFPERKAKSGEIRFSDVDHLLFDSKLFIKGRTIAFMLGWSNELSLFGPYFMKTVKKTYPENGHSTLTVKFQDKTYKLNKQNKRKKHTGSPKTILRKIAANHKLKYNIEDIEGLKFSDDFPLMQANMTDAALIQKLAMRYGYVWGIEGSTLYFRKPDADFVALGKQTKIPVLSYKINDYSIRSFDPDMKYTKKKKRVNAENKFPDIDIESDGYYNTDAAMTDVAIGFEIDGSTYASFPLTQPSDPNSIEQGLADEVFMHLDEAYAGEEVSEEDEDLAGFGKFGVPKPVFNPNAPDPQLDPDSSVTEGFYITGNTVDVTTDWELDERVQDPDVEILCVDLSALDPEEVERRKEAVRLTENEIVTGTLVPHRASIKYVPGSSMILAGLGERLSGKYKVNETTLNVSEGAGAFESTHKVSRRTLIRDEVVMQLINEATADAQQNQDSTTQEPEPIPSDFLQQQQNDIDEQVAALEAQTSGEGQGLIDSLVTSITSIFENGF